MCGGCGCRVPRMGVNLCSALGGRFPRESGVFSLFGFLRSCTGDTHGNMYFIRALLMLSSTYQPFGGDGDPVGVAGLNNFRVTRLAHRSVLWLLRK